MKKKGRMAYTPDLVENLMPGQVFVFGSNLIGYHSGGASLIAMQRFGAVWGQAEGPQGQCYAIPVDIRGEAVDNVSAYMKRHIDKFLSFAKAHQELFFLVPRIGCGAAGFDDEFMASFFKEAINMKNVSLPQSFVQALNKSESDNARAIQKVFNLIILDESGSMQTIEKQAVSGLNETFQTISNAQKEHQEQCHFISFVTFNSDHIKKVMDRHSVETGKKLTWNDYYPDACTPLFDAMGRSLNELKTHVGKDDVVLVTIITDGYENASREYSGNDIKRLVSELKEKGWIFAYIGTNQDVDAVADSMGIRSRMYYEYSDTGAEEMFACERSSKQAFFDRLSRKGRSFIMEDDYDYFNPNDDEAEPEKDPDIVWDVNNISSSDNTESQENISKEQKNENQHQESEDSSKTTEAMENTGEPGGFWNKIKNIIKG